MKNILLATTAVFFTAGIAAADVTWSGSASVGIAREGAAQATKAPTGTNLTKQTNKVATAKTALDAAYKKVNDEYQGTTKTGKYLEYVAAWKQPIKFGLTQQTA